MSNTYMLLKIDIGEKKGNYNILWDFDGTLFDTHIQPITIDL